MIRVNLSGAGKKEPVAKRAAPKRASSTNSMAVVHLLIVLGAGAAGYFWYTSLSGQSMELTNRISTLEEQQRQLETVIKQDEIYEGRRKALESRIKVIEDLRKNQVSPIMVLDALDDAVDQTRYVWLSSLTQSNTTFTMAGLGSSVDALSDFVANLKSTGYFHNINLARFDDSRGNYTFSMTCDFSPPGRVLERGAN